MKIYVNLNYSICENLSNVAVRHHKAGAKCQSCELYSSSCGEGCRAAALTISGRCICDEVFE
jgi:hypothetical protein